MSKYFLGCPPHTSTSSACYGRAIRCIFCSAISPTKGCRCYPSPKEKHSYFINSNAVETFYLSPTSRNLVFLTKEGTHQVEPVDAELYSIPKFKFKPFPILLAKQNRNFITSFFNNCNL